MTLKDLGYMIINTTDDSVTWVKGDEHDNYTLYFLNKGNYWTVHAVYYYFERNEVVMAPQDAQDDWISHSAKYGTHLRESAELDIEEIEAIAQELKRLNGE